MASATWSTRTAKATCSLATGGLGGSQTPPPLRPALGLLREPPPTWPSGSSSCSTPASCTAPAGSRTRGGRLAPRHLDRKIWELYASGSGYKRIAADLRLPRVTVRHRIAEVWRVYGHLAAPPSLAALVNECEPGALTMFFALLRRAIDAPAEVAAMLDEAEAMPEMRAIIEEGKA